MLVFRILCSGVLAWAVGWAVTRPEAAGMLRHMPEMIALAPIAGAYVGGVSLAVRQGWGFIVALANGVWAGVLAVVASGVLYLAVETARAVAAGEVAGFGGFFLVFSGTVDLLLGQLGDPQLLTLLLAATACAGLLTEAVHWLMVRARQHRQRSN
jgi:hypothetical protein